MSPKSLLTADTLGHRFFQLPRELRDSVYSFLVPQSCPIPLTEKPLQAIIPHPDIAAEVLEATYTHNTFETTIKPPFARWQRTEFTEYIRHLVVNTTDVSILDLNLCGEGSILQREEFAFSLRNPEIRKPWEDLLELPRLESLVINLQKQSTMIFTWTNFSPILCELRERLPHLRITFNVSFDDTLRSYWHDPRWGASIPYQPMGFINVSEMFEAPTEDDKEYVEKYLPEEKYTKARCADRGLLDETSAQRRILGQHYLVKEPALLRVLIAEHYEVYKKWKRPFLPAAATLT